MSKGSYSLADLLKELQAVEEIIGQNKNVQVAEKSYSSSKKSKKKKKAQKPGATPKNKKPKNGDGRSKGKCFTCSQKGH